jgi:hypothetical protein
VSQAEECRERNRDHKDKDTYEDESKGFGGRLTAECSSYDDVACEGSFLEGSGELKVAMSQLQVLRAAAQLEL